MESASSAGNARSPRAATAGSAARQPNSVASQRKIDARRAAVRPGTALIPPPVPRCRAYALTREQDRVAAPSPRDRRRDGARADEVLHTSVVTRSELWAAPGVDHVLSGRHARGADR